MKIINGNELWRKMESMPFFNRALATLNRQELETLLKVAVDHVLCDDDAPYGHQLPWYEGNGCLHIPWNAPEKYKMWKHKLTAKEKYDLLLCMAVPPEDMHYFMHRADIEEAGGIYEIVKEIDDGKRKPYWSKDDRFVEEI